MTEPPKVDQYSLGEALNYWQLDPSLQREVQRSLDADDWTWSSKRLSEFGAVAGEVARNAETVDRNPPILHTYDRDGQVVNEIEYHPMQVDNERRVYERGIVADAFHAPPGRDDPLPHTHTLAMEYLLAYADTGLVCPVGMTNAAAFVLERVDDQSVEPHFQALTERTYDDLSEGAMFLTERQGGSDVGAIETTAKPAEDGTWRLYGEKWFCSNLDAGVILTLARCPNAGNGTDGLSLFLVPRIKPDGDRNDYHFRRLKDKLGTRTVPTGEVAFEGTKAYLVGDPNQGFKYMTDMLNRSRLSVAMQGLGIAGRALLACRIHVTNREVFGERLADKPLMQRDLVAMTTRHEAELALGFEACRTFDRWAREVTSNAKETYRRMRLLVPLAKYRAARHGLETASYATEVLGGDGVVREFPTHRLLRDAQIQPIWEGTSNIMCLDVLRAIESEDAHEPVLADVERRLSAVESSPLARPTEVVQSRLASLRKYIATVSEGEHAVAEATSKALADELAAVSGAALLLRQADRRLD